MSWLAGKRTTTVSTVCACRRCRNNDSLAVSEVVQRALLVDDTHGSLLRADADALNIVRALPHLLELVVQDARSLNRRLGVELGRVRDFEKHVLHDVRAVRHLELKWLALGREVSYGSSRSDTAAYLEQHVVEAPGLRSQDRGHALLPALHKVGNVDGTRTRISSGPRLARASVGSMSVRAQRLAVGPRLGDSVDGLGTVKTTMMYS